MGSLFYGSARYEVTFPDRILAHLQIVMTAKLRRTEGFVLSWTEPTQAGSGRSMIWITAYTDLHYRFAGGKMPLINKHWLEQLSALANTSQGLYVTDEGTLQPLIDGASVLGRVVVPGK
jgi:hypothetical protein